MRFLFPLLALALAFIPAEGQAFMGGGTGTNIGTCQYPLPLNSDAVASAYSFRKLISAYSGYAAQLTRLSDSATMNIGFASDNCNFDKTTAATFCAATTCYVSTWYDQSGNSVNVTASNTNTVYTASCLNGQPCMTLNGTAYLGGTLASNVGADTIAMVASTTQMTSSFWAINVGTTTNYTGILFSTATNLLYSRREVAGTGVQGTIGISNNVPYRLIGTNNATLSSIYANGTKGTDDTSSQTLVPSNVLTIGESASHANALNGIVAETIIFAPDISITDSNTVSLNQKAYWGTM